MFVIDRLEGDRAVIDFDGEMIDIPLTALPVGTSEGDRVGFVVEHSTAEFRKEQVDRLARLQSASPDGDVFQL